MSDELGEVLVRLTLDEAYALYDNAVGTDARTSGGAKLRTAMREHIAAQNPLRAVLQLAADRLSTSPRHCLNGNCDKFEAGKPCDRCVAAAARRALNNGGDQT